MTDLRLPDPGLQEQRTVRGERSELWWHVAVVAWLIALAFAVLGPALSRGGSFGSYDLLGQLGLLHTNAMPHNLQAGDQVDQIIPWTTLAWQQVHSGHLPLWNPYAALGMPLAFNWQSASFSLPMVIGYLLPLRIAFTFQVILTLVIAGTGMYVLARVLRLGAVGSVFAATVFELCGPTVGWLGWPHAAVLSWSGWVFAAALVTIRGKHRIRSVISLALVVAAAVYAGQTEVLTIMGLALIVFVIVLMTLRASMSGAQSIRRPSADLVIGAVAGMALGAPLILPGLQIIGASQRGTSNDPGEILPGNPPLPFHNVTHLFFQAFDGLPIAGSRWFGYAGGYSETAAYVGVTVVVLAVAAFGVRHRQPEVTAFGVVACVMASITFVPPVAWLMAHLPLLGSVLWQRSVLLLVFVLSILGGFGMDALTKASLRRPVIRWSFGGFGVAAIGLLALWLFGRGDLPAAESSIRAGSFAWPAAEVVVGLVVLGGIVLMERRDRARHRLARQPDERPIWGAAVILLICSTGFLLAAGMPIWTSASAPFTPTPAVRALKDIVGSSVVGFGASLCFFPPGLGILPNAQSAYGIQELGLYDPMIPKRYFTAWTSLTGRSAGDENDSAYCPVITTSRQARLYGVGYVVEQAHAPGPVGSVLAGTVGGEEIFRIPGSSSASLVPSNQPAIIGASEIGARPVRVMHPDPTTWRLSTRAPGAERLILRLTDVPGWHATIDGRTATLNRFAGVMMELEVPPGGHEIQVTYWPESFAVGIVIAMVTALAMLVIGGIGWYRVRKQTFE